MIPLKMLNIMVLFPKIEKSWRMCASFWWFFAGIIDLYFILSPYLPKSSQPNTQLMTKKKKKTMPAHQNKSHLHNRWEKVYGLAHAQSHSWMVNKKNCRGASFLKNVNRLIRNLFFTSLHLHTIVSADAMRLFLWVFISFSKWKRWRTYHVM